MMILRGKALVVSFSSMVVLACIIWILLLRQFGALPTVRQTHEVAKDSNHKLARMEAKIDSLRQQADSIQVSINRARSELRAL